MGLSRWGNFKLALILCPSRLVLNYYITLSANNNCLFIYNSTNYLLDAIVEMIKFKLAGLLIKFSFDLSQ